MEHPVNPHYDHHDQRLNRCPPKISGHLAQPTHKTSPARWEDHTLTGIFALISLEARRHRRILLCRDFRCRENDQTLVAIKPRRRWGTRSWWHGQMWATRASRCTLEVW